MPDKKTREFHDTQGTTHKYWRIQFHGDAYTLEWGRIGAQGTARSRSFDTADEAKFAGVKLIADKLREGYFEVAPRQAATGGNLPNPAALAVAVSEKIHDLEKLHDRVAGGKASPSELEHGLQEALALLREQHHAYASICDAAVRDDGKGGLIRAIGREDPGTPPVLLLEHLEPGDDHLPIAVREQVEVTHQATSSIANLRFEGDRLLFTADSGEFAVDVSGNELGDLAEPAQTV